MTHRILRNSFGGVATQIGTEDGKIGVETVADTSQRVNDADRREWHDCGSIMPVLCLLYQRGNATTAFSNYN